MSDLSSESLSVSSPMRLRRLWDAGERAEAVRAALEDWTRVVDNADDYGWLEGALRDCGLPVQAFALRVETTRRSGDLAAWEQTIRDILRSGDPWWARELLREVGDRSRELRSLQVESDLAIGDASESIASWLSSYDDEEARACAVRWYVENDQAERAPTLAETCAGNRLWRGRLELWRNRPVRAREVLAGLDESAETRCLMAIADVLEGRPRDAEAVLRELVGIESVAAEAGSWLATSLRKQGRYDEAVRAADQARIFDTGFSLATRLERELCTSLGSGDAGSRATPGVLGKLLARLGLGKPARDPRVRRIRQLEHSETVCQLGLQGDDPVIALEDLLDRFAGNRSASVTTTDGETLTSHPLPIDPRQLGADIQRVLWTRGEAAARELYRTLSSTVDDHPLFLIYQGEVELWLGCYDEAERIFRGVIERERETIWAWIGLGASAMLRGELDAAQEIWAEGLRVKDFVGPTLYVYRGECYRRQGDLERARLDLRTAVEQKPQRLSARINLALVDREPSELARVERECEEVAPFLMQQLHGSATERLEGVLDAMAGNRSSSAWLMSYRLWGRRWRRAAGSCEK